MRYAERDIAAEEKGKYLSDQPGSAVIARTDPNEQESVVLLPELEALVPL